MHSIDENYRNDTEINEQFMNGHLNFVDWLDINQQTEYHK